MYRAPRRQRHLTQRGSTRSVSNRFLGIPHKATPYVPTAPSTADKYTGVRQQYGSLSQVANLLSFGAIISA